MARGSRSPGKARSHPHQLRRLPQRQDQLKVQHLWCCCNVRHESMREPCKAKVVDAQLGLKFGPERRRLWAKRSPGRLGPRRRVGLVPPSHASNLFMSGHSPKLSSARVLRMRLRLSIEDHEVGPAAWTQVPGRSGGPGRSGESRARWLQRGNSTQLTQNSPAAPQ